MIAALALAAYLVRPGDTLSGIAATNGITLAAVEAANPGISNPNVIYPGETVVLPGAGSYTPPQQNSSAPVSAPVQQSAPVSSGGGFQQCVVQHESNGDSQVMNSSGHYGLYQFDYPTWVAGGGNPADFGHASVSEQDQVFSSTYASRGAEPWQGDGC